MSGKPSLLCWFLEVSSRHGAAWLSWILERIETKWQQAAASHNLPISRQPAEHQQTVEFSNCELCRSINRIFRHILWSFSPQRTTLTDCFKDRWLANYFCKNFSPRDLIDLIDISIYWRWDSKLNKGNEWIITEKFVWMTYQVLSSG